MTKFDDSCISCGGCNTVCPTCSCFDTTDVIYNETSREGERRRVWPSCMLDTFTMSSVHNATEHSYVKEQSKGCSFAISMGLFAPVERLRLLHFFYPALPTRYSTATPDEDEVQ